MTVLALAAGIRACETDMMHVLSFISHRRTGTGAGQFTDVVRYIKVLTN